MAEIILIEPDTVLANVYKTALEYQGHSVRRSVSAQNAVFLVDEKLPDVVIVELQLVAHSGIEFLYELRSYSEWQNIPVLIHSCIPPTEFTKSLKLLRDKLGVQKYLYKPRTSLQTLLRSVTEAVSQYEVMHQTAEIGMIIPRNELKVSSKIHGQPIPAAAVTFNQSI